METRENPQLAEVVEEMKGLRIEDCEMAHECIKREPGSLMPLAAPAFCDADFLKESLCPPEKRDHLGCAHTNYRQKATYLLEDLARAFPPAAAAARTFTAGLREIEWEIIQIDTRRQEEENARGHLAKALCEADPEKRREREELAMGLEKAEGSIRELIHAHNRQNDRLRRLREELVRELEELKAV